MESPKKLRTMHLTIPIRRSVKFTTVGVRLWAIVTACHNRLWRGFSCPTLSVRITRFDIGKQGEWHAIPTLHAFLPPVGMVPLCLLRLCPNPRQTVAFAPSVKRLRRCCTSPSGTLHTCGKRKIQEAYRRRFSCSGAAGEKRNRRSVFSFAVNRFFIVSLAWR